MLYLHFFCVIAMFINGRMLIYKTFIIWLRSFLSIHLGEERGGTNACICMGTHSLSYRTDWWLLTKLGRDEVIMALHMRLGFSARFAQRWIRGCAKVGQLGAPSLKDLFQIGMQQQQTECILVSWIEILWLFAVRTDFTNMAVLLSDLSFA